jgi:hypothetical protein
MLRDQLAWLMDEAAALSPLLRELPDWALAESALAGERSVKGALARMAALDAGPRTAWLRSFSSAEAADLRAEEPAGLDDPAARGVEELLDGVRDARAGLLAVLATVADEDWSREATLDGEAVTLYEVALRIAREDADELRGLAYRLHEARPGRAGR